MSKPTAQPVDTPYTKQPRKQRNQAMQEPLSGSKKTKQANHSRHNNGEG
ncbi:MAG: Small acid-soluble spore protein family [Paenibacillus sp.]|jgi:small acid-soluble spore protein P (minor)|nr:Small acid-soluble spore protein family [Paenibacillus sp.]